jgi:hypothetical protein
MGNNIIFSKPNEIFVAISNKYIPIVNINFEVGPFRKTLLSKKILFNDVVKCFNENDELIIMTLYDALSIIDIFNINCISNIDDDICFLGSPMFFELNKQFELTNYLEYNDINEYMDIKNFLLRCYIKPIKHKYKLYENFISEHPNKQCKFTKSVVNLKDILNVYHFNEIGIMQKININ